MKNSESGIHINVENLDPLIKKVEKIGPRYNPVKETLQIPSLREKYEDGKKYIKDVNDALGEWKLMVDDRQVPFKKVKPLVTRIIGSLYGMEVPASFIEDAKQYQAKINSKRLTKPKAADIEKDLSSDNKQHSVSQQSYNSLLNNFEAFIKLLDKTPNYQTNIPDLSITALYDFYKQLEQSNLNMNTAATNLSNVRIQRNLFLYTPETGLVDTALSVKNYVKGIFGATHPTYLDIKKIRFANRRKK